MSSEVLVDALPYIDQGYDDPGVRETTMAMVEEECRRFRPTKNYLEHLPQMNTTAYETPLMLNEFERMAANEPLERLSMKRYGLPLPPLNKISELSAWQESVENSMAQLEHQAVRALNLELMLEYNCEAWKVHLDIFTALQAKAQLQLDELEKQRQEINWQRKSQQTQAGEKLRSLEEQWVMLVSKNYEIEQACAKLEERIDYCKGQLNEEEETEEEKHATDDREEDNDEEEEQRPAAAVQEEHILNNDDDEQSPANNDDKMEE